MSGRSAVMRFIRALGCMGVASMILTGVALGAAVPHPHVGKLAGFPAVRGVVPVLASRAAVSGREKLVNSSFAEARTQHEQQLKGTSVPNEGALSKCAEAFEEELSFLTQDMCYRGGPVMRGATIHLIFWQGPVNGSGEATTTNVETFTEGYVNTVEQYFADLAHDSGGHTNVFAVDPQYGEEGSEGRYLPGEYALSFSSPADVTIDNTAFPIHLTGGCEDRTEYSKGPCLLDEDVQHEVTTDAASKVGLNDLYLVLTPPGVGSCFEAQSGECSYQQYCAYHSDFGGNGKARSGQTIYANLPFVGKVPGCDLLGVHPNAFTDNGADAVIDTASHEVNEAITDPIGSQCDEEGGEIKGCEQNAWTDAIGQEVADKCLPPETTILGLSGIYGEPLGEVIPNTGTSAYNQVISGRFYWTQREWSNEAGLFEGACVQRIIEAGFTPPSSAAATVRATFDGSASGAPGDPATYWVWDFGDGEKVGTASPTVSHTYAKAGTYFTTVTAYDAFGSSAWTWAEVKVGPAPPPPAAPMPVTNTVTVTTPPPPVLKYSAEQMAKLLGLPQNGKTLFGLGTMDLGKAECPPACDVTLKMYAKVKTVSHKHRVTKLVLVGQARRHGMPKGAVFVHFVPGTLGELLLSLNAKGRALLRRHRLLSCNLIVTVEGQEGGVWTITRSLKLKR